MTRPTDYSDLLKNHVALTGAKAKLRRSRPETSFALIDRLIDADADRIGTLGDHADEFDISMEVDVLRQRGGVMRHYRTMSRMTIASKNLCATIMGGR